MDFGLVENLFPLVLAILLALVVPTAMVVSKGSGLHITLYEK